MSIRWKILVAFSIPIVLLIATALTVNATLRTMQSAVTVVTTGVEVQAAGAQAEEMIAKLREHAEPLPDADNPQAAVEVMKVFWDELRSGIGVIEANADTLGIDPEAIAKLQESLAATTGEYEAVGQAVAAAEVDIEVLFEHAVYFDEELSGMAEKLSVLNVSLRERIEEAIVEEKRVHNRPAQAMMIATAIGTLLLLGTAWLFTRMLVKPIVSISRHLQDIAEGEGDLTKRVDSTRQDEVGQLGHWFNTFIERIHDMIVEVKQVTSSVDEAAASITRSCDEIGEQLEYQTDEVNRVSAAIEEVTVSTTHVADRSVDTSDQAAEAGKIALSGGELVSQTLTDMASIRDEVSASAVAVEALGKRGDEIGQITVVINDIADQTNLLALNAAIEAARAGEHGRGFAVVADEVRKLADRTTQATSEIAKSIGEIQGDTARAVDRMNQGNQQVSRSLERASEAGASLEKIVDSTGQVSYAIKEISSSAREQSAAAADVARGVEQIVQLSDKTAESGRTSRSVAFDLTARVNQLQNLVNEFTVDAQGKSAAKSGSPSSDTDAETDVEAENTDLFLKEQA